MEFDKSKILTCVTADQAKVGMKGWASCALEDLISKVESNEQTVELIDVLKLHERKFITKGRSGHTLSWPLFYPAPEPAFKVGDRVEVITDIPPLKQGMKGKITDPCYGSNLAHVAVEGKGDWGIQKSTLKVIPEPTYRPFANAEEFKPYRDEWVRIKRDGAMIRWFAYNDDGVQDTNGNIVTYKDLLEKAEHENGEPCGMKEEV